MALLFMDGFDHYATADITKKWTSASAASIGVTSGRRGGGAITSATVSKTLPGTYSTIIAGFARNNWPADGVGFSLMEGTTYHISVVYSGGKIKIYRGTQYGTVLGVSATTLSAGYNYIEIKATIHDSTGAVEVKINGITDNNLNLTNVDTRNGGTGVIDTILVAGTGYTDDLYVCDTSGATNNNFLGDCRIDTLLPSGDGNYTQFTPSTGTAHYATVDESTPNTTDYNYSSTSGDRDSYTFPDLTGLISQTIYGVQINAAVLKSDSGSRSLGTMSRLSGTNKDGSGAALSTSQTYISEIQETDPSSAAWTEANINAAEFGVKVTA